MQAAILKQRSVLDEHTVTGLYKSAKALFYDPAELGKADATKWKSRIVTDHTPPLVMATCTDVNTGLFVQLTAKTGAVDSDLMLTFGHKYCQEVTDTMRGNRATKIW